jgi:hypothetical protein
MRTAIDKDHSNPAMDLIIGTLKLMLLVLLLKQPPAPPISADAADTLRINAAAITEAEAVRRMEAARIAWSEQLSTLPRIQGRVSLAIDVSTSMSDDQITDVAATAATAILINNPAITQLRLTCFAHDVEEVLPWTELDASHGLSDVKRAELVNWIKRNLGASDSVATELANGQRLDVIRTILNRSRATKSYTNLVGAIEDGIKSTAGDSPGTVIVITDGMHMMDEEPGDVAGVQKLLTSRLAALHLQQTQIPTVHTILLVADEKASAASAPSADATPKTEDLARLLRWVTRKFKGVLLVLPAPPTIVDTKLDQIERGIVPLHGGILTKPSQVPTDDIPFYRADP